MDINGSSRSQLKTYFIKHALPSEGQFSELIDGMLNQRDDRLVKTPGSPLSLEVTGDSATRQQVLHFYESFDDANPTWALTMNPRTTVSDPTTARSGLSVDDGSGISRLFIDHASGRVGVGTIDPQAALHVMGDIICSGTVTAQPQPSPLQWTEMVGSGTADPNLTQMEMANNWGPWTDLKYGFVWDSPGFAKDDSGLVHLKGAISGGIKAGGTVMFKFPDDIVAQGPKIVTTWAQTGAATLDIIVVENNGVKTCELRCGANIGAWVSLEGLSFSVQPPV